MNVTDRQTDGHRPTAKTARLYAERRAVTSENVTTTFIHTPQKHFLAKQVRLQGCNNVRIKITLVMGYN